MLLPVTLSRLSAHHGLRLMVASLSGKRALFPLFPQHMGCIPLFRVVWIWGRRGRIVWFFPSCCFPGFACLFVLFSFSAFCSWTVISLLDFIALMKAFPCRVWFLTFVSVVEDQKLLLSFCCYQVSIMWLRLWLLCYFLHVSEEKRQVWFLKKNLRKLQLQQKAVHPLYQECVLYILH